ncbi:DUF2182 domain-containing protein [Haloferacaceae archaeon DSL9]
MDSKTGIAALFPGDLLSVASDRLLLGGAFVAVAGFQFSSHTRGCLHHCRSPNAFLAHHDRPGISGALRAGWHLGRCDLGACWALMGLLVALGSMNLLWMAAITVAMIAEHALPQGDAAARGIGVAAGVVGVWLLVTLLV